MKNTGLTTNVRLVYLRFEKDHGQEMVALCSKTYVLEDRDGFCKTALKGLNKADIEKILWKSAKKFCIRVKPMWE